MLKIITLFFITTAANAANYVASWDRVTLKTDGSEITGEVSYKLFGGEPGSVGEIANTTELTTSGEIDLPGGIGEFYLQGCIDGRCGASTETVTVLVPAVGRSINDIILNVQVE